MNDDFESIIGPLRKELPKESHVMLTNELAAQLVSFITSASDEIAGRELSRSEVIEILKQMVGKVVSAQQKIVSSIIDDAVADDEQMP